MSHDLGICGSGSVLFQGTYFRRIVDTSTEKVLFGISGLSNKNKFLLIFLHWWRESDYGWMFILNNIIMQHFIQSEVKTLKYI
jgi:hypothetical protein